MKSYEVFFKRMELAGLYEKERAQLEALEDMAVVVSATLEEMELSPISDELLDFFYEDNDLMAARLNKQLDKLAVIRQAMKAANTLEDSLRILENW